VEVLYICAEAVKQLIYPCKVWKEFKTTEIASAGFSGTIQQTFVQQSPSLLDLFCHP